MRMSHARACTCASPHVLARERGAQVSLGQPGHSVIKHEELLPHVRRLLREHGIIQFASFLFTPPVVSKPSLVRRCRSPPRSTPRRRCHAAGRPRRAAVKTLVASVRRPASRGNPWWATIVQDIGGTPATDDADRD